MKTPSFLILTPLLLIMALGPLSCGRKGDGGGGGGGGSPVAPVSTTGGASPASGTSASEPATPAVPEVDELFNLKDQETGTTWNIKGEAISGLLEGRKLEQIPAHNAMWFAWLAFWGDTEVYGLPMTGDGMNFQDLNPFPTDKVFSGGVSRDGIPALTDPRMQASSNARWADSDIVLGVEINGDARAYPHAIGWWHEIVNDVVGGQPICVTFCPLTCSGLVFDGDRGAGADRLELGVSGQLFNSNLIMFDKGDGRTLYPQMLYEPINKEEVPDLELLPVVETTWGLWKRLHPDTKVVNPETGHGRNYDQYPYGNYRSAPYLFYPLAQDLTDHQYNRDRILYHPKQMVLGILGELGTPRAYPFIDLGAQEAINDLLDGRPILIVWNREGDLAIPYSREVDGTVLTFDIVPPLNTPRDI